MKPDLSQNANRFIIFSVFFTARAYYPVLAILFLDLGLSLDQFVLLNLIWAATIFLFEVPSGALQLTTWQAMPHDMVRGNVRWLPRACSSRSRWLVAPCPSWP